MKLPSAIVAKILVESVEGSSIAVLSTRYNCAESTIGRLRKRYLTAEQKEIIASRKFYDSCGNQLSCAGGNIPYNQIAILDVLRLNGPMRFNHIKKAIGNRSIGDSINTLIKKGFVVIRLHKNYKYYIVTSSCLSGAL